MSVYSLSAQFTHREPGGTKTPKNHFEKALSVSIALAPLHMVQPGLGF